jgi:ABC-2 type transport system permease protein
MNQRNLYSAWLLPIASLWRRDVVRFLRQRSRIVGALGTPIVFWLLIGSGMRHSFKMTGSAFQTDYLEYAFPGTVVLIVLFTAIFSMISLIEDRREGFMQGVLVAPVGRSVIVLGKVLGSTTLAFGQSVLFLLLAPTIGISMAWGSVGAVLSVLIIISLGLSGLGFLIAWPMDSTQGFHAVMNLFLVPMWLLSGAFFPASGASGWVGWLMTINPLTYGVAAMRHAMYWGDGLAISGIPSPEVSVAVTIGFMILMIMLASRSVVRRG